MNNTAENGKMFGIMKDLTENGICKLRVEGWVGIYCTRKGQRDQGCLVRQGEKYGENKPCLQGKGVRMPGKIEPVWGKANAWYRLARAEVMEYARHELRKWQTPSHKEFYRSAWGFLFCWPCKYMYYIIQ